MLYCPFLVITIILMISVLTKKPKIRFDYLYLALCVDLLLWLLAEIVLSATKDHALIEYLIPAKLAFSFSIPTLFLLAIVEFYNLWKPSTAWIRLLTAAVPAVVAVLALSNPLIKVFVDSVTIDTSVDPTYIRTSFTIWYYVSLAYMQVAAISIAVIIATQRRKLPPEYRSTIRLFTWVLIIYLAGTLVQFSGVMGDSRIQTTLIALCVGNLLFFVAVASNGRADFLNVWRRDVFDYLEEAIITVDDQRRVVNANAAAKKMFKNFDVEFNDITIDELDEKLYSSGKAFKRELHGEANESVARDLYLTEGKYPVIYEVLIKAVPDFLEVGSGEYQILTEVTRNRIFIERLRDLAGVDTLTGLKNRYSYEQSLREWDVPDSLPLSIIIGDLNGLKYLNDIYGHNMGDQYLSSVANVLKMSVSENGFAARIGGDEFVIVLKGCDDRCAQNLIAKIQDQVEHIEGLPEIASIALGSATKNKPDENINALYAKADAYMYENKHDRIKVGVANAEEGSRSC